MFLNQEVYAQVCDFIPTGTPANPKTNDNPYIPAGPLSSYERYLARSVQMNLLPTLLLNNNTNSNTQFNGSICTDPCLQDCRNAFCCQKYNQDINMLADINAAYIVAAGYYEPNLSLWAASDIDHNPLYTGINPSLEVIKRIPKDINEAYDYRGLRRPIIDNFIAENINGTISEVKIPKSVIKLFIDEMSYSEKTTYLINPAIIDNPNAPNDFSNIRDIYFNFNKSSWSYTYEQTTVNSMDVNKIEGRMWLFFISKQYIDMGYTSINLSQANFFFSKDEAKTYGNIPTELNNLSQSEKEANAYPPNGKQIYSNDVKKGYYNLGRACSKIRDYAASKGKFILLWTQADRIYYAYKEIATTRKGITTYTYQKENKYIFDFNSSAMRVREVDDSHLNEGRNLAIGSTVPSKPAMTEAAFNAGMPRCTSCLKAAVDP